jgi:hypothetical protein
MNRSLLAALATALAATAAQASPSALEYAYDMDTVAPPAPPGGPEGWHEWAEDFSRDMHASMGAMFSGRVDAARIVKGAPYSAEIVTETKQTLGDGNIISRKTVGAVYRDGEGRTRQETATREGKARNVYINDPVAGKRYIVVPGTRHPISLPDLSSLPRPWSKQVVKVDGKEIRVEDGVVTIDGKEVPGSRYELKTEKGKTVRVADGKITIDGHEVDDMSRHGGSKIIVGQTTGADGLSREEVRVQVVRIGDDMPIPPTPPTPPTPPLPPGDFIAPLAPLPPMPGMNELRFESSSRLGKGVTTSLGAKDFDGVKAQGTSTVWTIPAGQIGNRDAIRVTSESWYSPDLLVTVYSRYSDPRTGESIYRLASLKRGEPDATLFAKPPEDAGRERDRNERGRPERQR